MGDQLARIPFSHEEEHTIGSMARWMRFMAIIGIAGAVIVVALLVVAIGLYSAVQALPDSSAAGGAVRRLGQAAGPLLMLAMAAAIAATAVGIWQNVTLYRAGDYFDLVARSDASDLDYLARGLDRLRTFFKIQVVMVIAVVVAAFAAAAVMMTFVRPT